MNNSYVERFPNVAKLARKSIALEVLHDNVQPSRDELIATIQNALERTETPYYLLHAAAALLTDGGRDNG